MQITKLLSDNDLKSFRSVLLLQMSDTSLQNAIVKALDELNKELTLLRDSVNVRQFEKGTSIAKPQFDIKPYIN